LGWEGGIKDLRREWSLKCIAIVWMFSVPQSSLCYWYGPQRGTIGRCWNLWEVEPSRRFLGHMGRYAIEGDWGTPICEFLSSSWLRCEQFLWPAFPLPSSIVPRDLKWQELPVSWTKTKLLWVNPSGILQ
jgi:hypothetical protein